MQYDLSKLLQLESFRTRSDMLIGRGAVVDLTEKVFRSPNQNRYMHLIVGVVAMETGTTLEEAKAAYFKRICNPGIFCVRRTDRLGNDIDVLRSSSDLTKEEMSTAIDRFKMWAVDNGIYLPGPGDDALLREIEIEMGRMKQYL